MMEGQRPCSDTIVLEKYGNLIHFNVQLFFIANKKSFVLRIIHPYPNRLNNVTEKLQEIRSRSFETKKQNRKIP
jgi:hypothetical protein